jgi:hypothetical protein
VPIQKPQNDDGLCLGHRLPALRIRTQPTLGLLLTPASSINTAASSVAGARGGRPGAPSLAWRPGSSGRGTRRGPRQASPAWRGQRRAVSGLTRTWR